MLRRLRHTWLLAALFVVGGVAWLSSCSDDSGTEPVKLSYGIKNAQLKAGYYCVCWNQKDQKGKQVDPGGYLVQMTASNYHATIDFTINGNSASIAAPICCDTATVGALKPTGEIPDVFSLSINSRSYSTGDSIAVDFALPVSCKCVIEMVQR
jgi:hypothetical protein